jgi:hypothetical protein
MNRSAPTNGKESDPAPGELESLYLELLKRYYEEGDRKRAGAAASRLEEALTASPEYAHSIRGEEVRSIIAELRGDLPRAIQGREAEIRKILELHERAANTETWGYVSGLYDYGDVSDRLDLLAILYDKQGELDRAVAILVQSKDYCRSRDIPFDAQDLLDELERAREAGHDRVTTPDLPRHLLDDAIRGAYGQFGTTANEIVVRDEEARLFAARVNQSLPGNMAASTQDIKRRLLTLARRGEAHGGLPPVKRGARRTRTGRKTGT